MQRMVRAIRFKDTDKFKEQFRSAMSKERKNGKEFHAPKELWADARTPLWDEKKVLAWAKDRKKRKKRKKEEKEEKEAS